MTLQHGGCFADHRDLLLAFFMDISEEAFVIPWRTTLKLTI